MFTKIFTAMFNYSEFYRFMFRVHIWRCINQTEQYELDIKTDSTWNWKDLVEYYIRQYGGHEMAEMFQCMFCSRDNETNVIIEQPGCGSKTEWRTEVDLYPLNVLYWFSVIMLLSFSVLLLRYLIRKAIQFNWKEILKKVNVADSKVVQNGKIPNNSLQEDENASNNVDDSKADNGTARNSRSSNTTNNYIVSQRYIKRDSYRYTICPTVSDVSWFLKNTIDFFFIELDKFLICQTIPSNIPVLRRNNNASSPRLDATRHIRRARSGSSPALNGTGDHDDGERKKSIKEFQEVVHKSMNPYFCDVDEGMIHNYGGHIKTLLQFYIENCSIQYDQWYVASLVVGYSLVLLQKELEVIGSMHGLRFVKFSSTGSMRKGLKIHPVNQFDVHMVIQGVDFNPCMFIDQNQCNNIQPGKLILCAKQTQTARAPWISKCLKSFSLNGSRLCCISSQEVLSVTEEFVDRALQRLYTETRSLIDRLPFRIQRSATPDLTLSVDTKNLIGLNLPEIKVRLIPSFPVAVDTWLHPVYVYAVPPWVNMDFKRKPNSFSDDIDSQIDRSDIIWSLSFGELESSYLERIDQKMEMAGVHSCHRVCLSILKTLLTSVTKKTLLDRGEVSPYVLETIVYHLLLESSPQLWNFDKLQDRLSVCIIFLHGALHNRRLPSFFVNNLYLVKQMPIIQSWTFLTKGHQDNLLGDITDDLVDKTRHYIQKRLAETQLKRCINDVYSPEMWEYEFFLL